MAGLRQPAFANQLRERRIAGERIGLLVLAVHHWNCGDAFAERPGAFRIVIPPDLPPAGADYSSIAGLDVVICGTEWPAMYMAARGAIAAPSASVWVELADGVKEVEHHWSCPPGELLSVGGFVPPGAFARHLQSLRKMRLLSGDGVYGAESFRAVREQAWIETFGTADPMALS